MSYPIRAAENQQPTADEMHVLGWLCRLCFRLVSAIIPCPSQWRHDTLHCTKAKQDEGNSLVPSVLTVCNTRSKTDIGPSSYVMSLMERNIDFDGSCSKSRATLLTKSNSQKVQNQIKHVRPAVRLSNMITLFSCWRESMTHVRSHCLFEPIC